MEEMEGMDHESVVSLSNGAMERRFDLAKKSQYF